MYKFIIFCGRYRFFFFLIVLPWFGHVFSNKGRFGHKRKLPGFLYFLICNVSSLEGTHRVTHSLDPPGLLEVHSGAALALDDWPFDLEGQRVGFHRVWCFVRDVFGGVPLYNLFIDHMILSEMFLEGQLYYKCISNLYNLYLWFRWFGMYFCGRGR